MNSSNSPKAGLNESGSSQGYRPQRAVAADIRSARQPDTAAGA
jgi:hypothetical protein